MDCRHTTDPSVDDSARIEVYSTRNSSEAHFLKDLLTNAGIPAVVVDDIILAGGSQSPHARVCVQQCDQAAADAIVREWQHPSSEHLPSWTCGQCGEEIDSQFESCWNCTEAG